MFLFLSSFRFSNIFCFLFSILRQNIFFIKVTSEQVNLLINILLHCTEGPKLKKCDFRWVELGLIRAVGLKGDEIACSGA